eukprot:gene3747-13807_t
MSCYDKHKRAVLEEAMPDFTSDESINKDVNISSWEKRKRALHEATIPFKGPLQGYRPSQYITVPPSHSVTMTDFTSEAMTDFTSDIY